MTQYEFIRETRRILKLNGGLTAAQTAFVLRCDTAKVISALRVMGDAYIDRWTMIGGDPVPVWELVEKPENCPRPEKK